MLGRGDGGIWGGRGRCCGGGAAAGSHLRLIPAQGISSGCCQAGNERKKSRNLAGPTASAGKAIGGGGDTKGGTQGGGPPTVAGLGGAEEAEGRMGSLSPWGGVLGGGGEGRGGREGGCPPPGTPRPLGDGRHRCHCVSPPSPWAINSPGAARGGHGAKNNPGGTVAAGVCRGRPSIPSYTQYTQLQWPSSSGAASPPSPSSVRLPSHRPQ